MEIPALSSYIRRKDMDSVLNCMVSDKLAPGDYVEKLQKLIRERLDWDFSLPLRSPVVALGVAMDVLGLRTGDAVGVPALAPVWVARALELRGLSPVWLDADPDSASLSADFRDRLAAGGAKALFLAQPWGLMADPAALRDLGIPVVEDVSTALGASAGDVKAGQLGTFALLGMEHASSLTAGGGAILAAPGRREAQALRNASQALAPEELMPDMNAALAWSQLRDNERFLSRRRELAELYAQALARAHRKALAQAPEGESAYYGCVVILDSGVKDVRAYARKKDVGTAMAFENSCVAAGRVPEGQCPKAASLANRAVAFPLHPRIGSQAAQKVSKVLATLP